MNVIETKDKLLSIQKQIKDGVSITEWTCVVPEICNEVTVSVIGELWQERMIGGVLQGQDLINETLEFLMLPLLINKVHFMTYSRILETYTESIPKLDIDGIYEESIQALIKIGYDV